MPDLLTHVLAGFTLATLLACYYDWLRPPYVTAAMIGATLPDLNRIGLVVPTGRLEFLLGTVVRTVTGGRLSPSYVPIDWEALHTLPASVIVAGIGSLLVPAEIRRRVFACLVLGATSHHALDLQLVNWGGRSYDVLWPIVEYQPPTPGLYSSRDPWLAPVAAILAALAWLLHRRLADQSTA